MTSNSAGIVPPLSSGNRSFPLPPPRTASHDLQQTPRSWPRQMFNPNPIAPANFQEVSEPALKRQKVGDCALDVIEKTNGTLQGVLDIGNATSNNKGGPLVKSTGSLRSLPEGEIAENGQQSSLFPIRQNQIRQPVGVQQGRALAIERATARDAVPIKPYVPEPPSFAPRFHKAG